MKRLLALLLGALGLRALLRRREPHELAPSPAADLRARLADSRATAAAQVEDAAEPELPIDQVPDVDGRRADVHARARQAIDDLKTD
jgi:hypothetical protein